MHLSLHFYLCNMFQDSKSKEFNKWTMITCMHIRNKSIINNNSSQAQPTIQNYPIKSMVDYTHQLISIWRGENDHAFRYIMLF